MILRIVLTLVFFVAIDLYAWQVVKAAIRHRTDAAYRIVAVVYWSLPAILLFSMLVAAFWGSDALPKSAGTTLRSFLFLAYLAKFILAGTALVDDIRRLLTWAYSGFFKETAYNPSRSRFLARTGLFFSLAPAALLIYGSLRNKYRYRLHRLRVPVKNLHPDLVGLRIVQISDIHAGTFTHPEPVRRAVELINAEKPDIVFFTGDLINSRASEMTDYVDVFDKIKARYGVLSVLGNHDYGDYDHWDSPQQKRDNFNLLIDTHSRLSWTLLRNENRILTIRSARLAVIGVENYSALPQFPRYGDLAVAVAGTALADFKILLSHDPTHWDVQVVKDYPDIGLTLSGHTHGFQFGIEIPGFIKWSPSQYVYKRWAGLYTSGDQHLYVNRGLGMLGYPGRVGILPEITVMELVEA